MNDRSKGRLVADRINKLERKNKAQLSMFRAVSESQRVRERERGIEIWLNNGGHLVAWK